jgi:hypothetical protein
MSREAGCPHRDWDIKHADSAAGSASRSIIRRCDPIGPLESVNPVDEVIRMNVDGAIGSERIGRPASASRCTAVGLRAAQAKSCALCPQGGPAWELGPLRSCVGGRRRAEISGPRLGARDPRERRR